ncbi:MAG: sigma 54-interacting transcriptional regulator [Desulfobacterales bacterium]
MLKIRRPRTLKQALLIAMAVLVVASGTVISLIVTHRYGRSLAEEAAARAENIAHNLALDAADKILINDLVALQKLLNDQISSEPNIAYLFVHKGDDILTHTFENGVPRQLISANAATDTRKGHLEKIVSDTGDRYLDYAWPIFDGEAGTLRLGFSEERFRRQVTELWIQMSLATLLILAVTALLVIHFVNRLTRPLVSLTTAVEQIDEDRLDTQVQVSGRAEVNSLTEAFNSLLVRLKDYTRRLETTNRELADKHNELDRAHRQLHTTYRITQDLAAISSLQELCRYLIKRLQEIVECRQMAMVLLGHPGEDTRVFSTSEVTVLDEEAAGAVHVALRSTESMAFTSVDTIPHGRFGSVIESAGRLAFFPLRHRDHLIGGLVVGCPGDCRCIQTELDVIKTVLHQAAGALRRALDHETEVRNLRAKLETPSEFSGLVGRSPQMQVIYRLIEDVAPTDATILIQGESGTGKELVARAIHDRSPRKNRPFIVINCSAYSSTLLESELFGHEKGAFTGALRRKTGRFEQADGGTVFLDEIGEISPAAQIKLLRVIQSQKFERVGGEQTVDVNIRILAATNRDLMAEVQEGRFREDLFYRLNVIPIQMPALRIRPNDIPLLSDHFLKRSSGEQSKTIQGFSSEAMRMLLDYSWPGNVRELENSIEHAVVLAKGRQIEPGDLPGSLVDAVTRSKEVPNPKSITRTEETLIREVLDECNWNKSAAAERLGISRSTLYQKLKKYRILRPTLH